MAKYGCWNTERKDGYYAPDGKEYNTGKVVIRYKWIPDVMSKTCQYDKKQTDTRCKGCSK